MSRNTTQLTVTLDAEPDTDAEDMERLTRQLRDELFELDVQADFVTGGPAPTNTKAGEAIEWGTLLLTLAASGGVITTLINAIQAWLTNRNQPAAVTAEMGGDKLQITGNPSPEQQRIIEAFLQRHQPELPEAPLALPSIQNIHGWSAQQVQTLQQQTAQALGLAVEFSDRLEDGGQGPLMVVIPSGRFLMGSPEDEPDRSSDERQHEVEIKPFAIGKYAVTFEEYCRFADATERENSALGEVSGRRPIIQITWFDAVAYVEWLSQQTRKAYRLPTEAEWEYACRAGTITAYHFGSIIQPKFASYTNKIKLIGDDGLFDARFVGNNFIGRQLYTAILLKPKKEEFEKRMVAVGQYPANAWGLHDMHGNVWEWTDSEYGEGYGGAELRGISDPSADSPRVLRGGAWWNEPGRLRSAARWNLNPRFRNNSVGFRLAMD